MSQFVTLEDIKPDLSYKNDFPRGTVPGRIPEVYDPRAREGWLLESLLDFDPRQQLPPTPELPGHSKPMERSFGDRVLDRIDRGIERLLP